MLRYALPPVAPMQMTSCLQRLLKLLRLKLLPMLYQLTLKKAVTRNAIVKASGSDSTANSNACLWRLTTRGMTVVLVLAGDDSCCAVVLCCAGRTLRITLQVSPDSKRGARYKVSPFLRFWVH